MRALMWFRTDLRIRDNTALHNACADADRGVLAVFAICPKQWAEHDWGSMKVDFVLRNVAELRDALAKLNIPLKIVTSDRFNGLPKKLLQLAQTHDCDALYFNDEYEVNELARDAEVATLFEKNDRSVHRFQDQCILNVGEIQTQSGGTYSVFTPFKRKWFELFDKDEHLNVRAKPRKQPKLDIASDDVPSELKGFTEHRRPDLWPAGEKEVGKRLERFINDRVARYDAARDKPARDGTSTLSPYLACGVISPRECMAAALASNSGKPDKGKKGPTTWISELIWREFYRHVLLGYPHVGRNRPFKRETDAIRWRDSEKDFTAWCEGRTGFPIVDAAMRQLTETGWMHNRARMITAMFLTKDLFIDWRRGERVFMQRLVDGDFASNNGGWQWSASTGTDAAPYFRIFNPISQSQRFDPQGEYIRKFVRELRAIQGKGIHDPSPLEASSANYPAPIVDHKKAREHAIAAFKKLSK